MYLHIIDDQINQYDTLPVKIRLADGMTRTSLNELSKAEQESLGLFEYQDITPEFDAMSKTWDGQYQYDHDARAATKVLTDRPIETIKTDKMKQMLATQLAVQEAGFVCANGIKLQVREQDLSRWTQLTTTILAFQPAEATIRDYDNVNHTLPTAQVIQMMGEIAMWGQWFMADTWAKKDAILSAASADDLP